jgi:chorismate synthase
MAGNTFGTLFRVTTFGESHGPGIGVVIDGCPSGLFVDIDFINNELRRRKPGQSTITTQRNELEQVEVLSGLFNNYTSGAPLTFFIRNTDQQSQDYDVLKDVYRPSHADFTYQQKYGIRDHRGSGRASARETAARVIAGAVAKLLLKEINVLVQGYVSQVGAIAITKPYTELNLSQTESNAIRCPDAVIATKMIALIEQVKKKGDSIGGIITCVAQNVPIGLGEPVFDKLHADLGKAMLSINACKGFDIGSGFELAHKKGSELNDTFVKDGDKIKTTTNFSGGIQGGISNGMDIYFRCVFKPTSTIAQHQKTINTNGENVELSAAGRHDPCVLPRAVPIVEAMTAITLADHLLRSKIYD